MNEQYPVKRTYARAGKEADFVVMEPTATPLQQLRYDNSVSLVDKLFVMMTLGDTGNVVLRHSLCIHRFLLHHRMHGSKITNLNDDLKLALAAKDIRIEAPIPGKNTVGIEIPMYIPMRDASVFAIPGKIPNRMSRKHNASQKMESSIFARV